MFQPGFFDLSRRYARLDAKPDPLVALNKLIPWEEFRPKLLAALENAGLRAKAETRKSAAGRKPLDEILMFKVLVLQSLYNLGDDHTEYLIRDRLSFMRFLGLGLEGTVPDAKSIWLYREALAKDETAKTLFEAFDAYLKRQGYLAMGGQIVDATIVPVPRDRNTPEENAAIKAGEVPEGWAENPAKSRQKDLNARWTKKNGQSHYGYKNHINIDRRHKLIREYTVTDAARHDSQELETVLDPDNTASDIWADSAYRSAEIEQTLKDRGLPQPDSPQGEPAAQAHETGEAGQQDALDRAGAGGARVRPLHELDGWQTGSHDRCGAGAHEDRAAQPDLQHEAFCVPEGDEGGGCLVVQPVVVMG